MEEVVAVCFAALAETLGYIVDVPSQCMSSHAVRACACTFNAVLGGEVGGFEGNVARAGHAGEEYCERVTPRVKGGVGLGVEGWC